MESEQRFWIIFWSIIGLVVITSGSIIGFCVIRDNSRGYAAIQNLIAKGVSPIAASCAIWGVPGNSAAGAACVIAATQQPVQPH